jgi:cholesterol oxidase
MYDAIIIGTGFGGAAVAHKLAEAGCRILVLERGAELSTGEHYPDENVVWGEDIDRQHGWMDFRRFANTSVLSGVGVGGGSLVYGNIYTVPPPSVFSEGWPKEITLDELMPYYEAAGSRVGVQEIPDTQEWNRTRLLREAAWRLGEGHRYRKLELSVKFDKAATYALQRNPFGSDEENAPLLPSIDEWDRSHRGSCVHRGDCSIGCPVAAKNTLVSTYLDFLTFTDNIRSLHVVRDIIPHRKGYTVTFEDLKSGAVGSASASIVVLAAGSLGSTELLLKCRDSGSLPEISHRLGHNWSPNGFFFFPCFSKTTPVYPNVGPHSTCTLNYLDGSYGNRAFSIEDGGFPRLFGERLLEWIADAQERDEWTEMVYSTAKRSVAQSSVERTRENELLFTNLLPLIAQGIDSSNGRLRLRRGRLDVAWDLKGSHELFEAVSPAVRRICSSIGADFLVPFAASPPKHIITPHPLGGCPMGDSPETGVVDHKGQVFGYEGLYVADGSIFPRALGFPPSRTISALGERIGHLIAVEGRHSQSNSKQASPNWDVREEISSLGDENEVAATQEEEVGTQSRYPCMAFYKRGEALEQIADKNELSVSLLPLELHFWLDPIRSGITPHIPAPEIQKPQELLYPLTFEISVWSEDVQFLNNHQLLTLHAQGATDHAVFPIHKLPDEGRPCTIFLFMSYEGTVVGAFRVEALVNCKPKPHQRAQSIEFMYLTKDWFRFEKEPPKSALTILIDKRPEGLTVFTLRPREQPWGALAPSEHDFYVNNKDIYSEVQTLAYAAGEAVEQGKKFSFAAKGRRLANLGHSLFGQIFLQAISTDVARFPEEWIRELPEGATLTIAIGQRCQNLCVPWGLIYDQDPPYDHFDVPDLHGFWGYRFNIVVRPHSADDTALAAVNSPVRMGAAWLDHLETEELRKTLEPFERQKKLTIKPLRVKNHSLDILASEPFDLLEFFCHGHSKVPGLFDRQDFERFRENYLNSKPSGGERLMMAIESATDSLIEMNGGFVTLTKLADVLKNGLPASPIIFLSMCESAQFTSSGTGFVPLFLRRGARAVIGTEGPTLWSLSREMDTKIIGKLLEGETIGNAFYETRKELARSHMLALIYTLYGDGDAKLKY